MKKDIKKIKFEFDGDDILPLKHKFYSMEFNDNSDYMECKTNITDYMVDGTPREYISIVNDEDRETILNYMKNEDILNLEGNRINPEDGNNLRFGIVITLKEIHGKNRIDECRLFGWNTYRRGRKYKRILSKTSSKWRNI